MSTTENSVVADSYDYIVVGGGSAGCVLGRRLAESGSGTVLLIEAGPDDVSERVSDPSRWVQTLRSDLDWCHDYLPSPALDNRVIGIPRGKVLGGSSAINAMLWYRGHPSDYDAWELSGATGWNYRSMLPYFKRSEDWQGGESAHRGAGGPMRIETSADPHPIAAGLITGAEELGFTVLADANAESNAGATLANLTMRGNRRCSAADGYLRSIDTPTNLQILCGSPAVGLDFDSDRCVGVRHLINGSVRTTRADREVILSCGALESPRLLMLAGIGDPAELRRLGIPVRVALPGVGANLQDHPLLMGINFFARTPLGATRDNGGGSMLNWASEPGMPTPDLHAFIVQGKHAEPAVQQRYDLRGDVFAISPGLMRAKSIGRLRLTTAAPDAPLHIEPNFLSEPEDLAALCRSIDTVLDLSETRAFGSLVRGPAAPDRRLSESEKKAFVRSACSTFFHTSGTCAMGTDARAVVDPQLRVYGIVGLRVVDASVIPVLPSCNTGAPVIAIAERAADLIRGLIQEAA